MRVAAVVQARMGSTRLPGKSLTPVWREMTLLEMVLTRVKSAARLDGVILATSSDPRCDALEGLARRLEVDVVRGDEADVLSRYVAAVERFGLKTVVRVCADNPLVDPGQMDAALAFFEDSGLDYATSNCTESGLPDGLGCEIVRARTLAASHAEADAEEREHVTLHLRRRPSSHSLGVYEAPESLRCPSAKLDIDTPEDLERMRKFLAALPPQAGPLWDTAAVVGLCRDLGLCA